MPEGSKHCGEEYNMEGRHNKYLLTVANYIAKEVCSGRAEY